MAAPMEVAVCTDSTAQLWTCVVWELHSGANLLTYRGGQAGPRGLALLNGEYLLAAQLGKNYISVWELQRKDQLQQKIMCPGPVTCVTTAPNGLYVLAGIAENIYLWEVSTGNLLVILSRHYQDVSCLKFTGDSSHFVSGSKDCLVLAWSLCSVLQVDPSRIPAPRHVWSHHTLPVTDVHCGFGGPLARVATASVDQTVKLWELSSGELLLSVLFDVGVMAVTMDLAEHHMFCGGSDGSVFQVDLCTRPAQRERSFQPEQDPGKVFRGHRNQVTCLSVSSDGSVLLSGSHDETVRLWDVQSKQCIRTVTLKGPVTNAAIVLAPVSMLSSDFRPSLPLPHFNKHLLGAEHGDEPRRGGLTLRLGLHQQGSEPSYLARLEQMQAVMCSTLEKPGPAAGAGERAGGRGAEPAQDQPRPLRLLHAHHHQAGQVRAQPPGPGRSPHLPSTAQESLSGLWAGVRAPQFCQFCVFRLYFLCLGSFGPAVCVHLSTWCFSFFNKRWSRKVSSCLPVLGTPSKVALTGQVPRMWLWPPHWPEGRDLGGPQ
ncbi:WD repeat-containing protein 18 isoform X1 [Fukomys damarensis]|uniref:WD repeat-containing protein 18 isoform X1 n=1 Tax=Fukomys damarensis TaxID=885580 RepID=UPI00053F6D01|nr:WD repeat-containing protein 18 isoform X1 [Fukomys damarensis]